MQPNIPYKIAKPNNNLLTMESGNEGSTLIIVPPNGNAGEQEWAVEHPPGKPEVVTLRNQKYGLYAGVLGDLHPMSPIVATSTPYEFNLEGAYGPCKHRLFVDHDGQRMHVEYSMLRSYPPQCALSSMTVPEDPWEFQSPSDPKED